MLVRFPKEKRQPVVKQYYISKTWQQKAAE